MNAAPAGATGFAAASGPSGLTGGAGSGRPAARPLSGAPINASHFTQYAAPAWFCQPHQGQFTDTSTSRLAPA
jgi:hypothetical protein